MFDYPTEVAAAVIKNWRADYPDQSDVARGELVRRFALIIADERKRATTKEQFASIGQLDLRDPEVRCFLMNIAAERFPQTDGKGQGDARYGFVEGAIYALSLTGGHSTDCKCEVCRYWGN